MRYCDLQLDTKLEFKLNKVSLINNLSHVNALNNYTLNRIVPLVLQSIVVLHYLCNTQILSLWQIPGMTISILQLKYSCLHTLRRRLQLASFIQQQHRSHPSSHNPPPAPPSYELISVSDRPPLQGRSAADRADLLAWTPLWPEQNTDIAQLMAWTPLETAHASIESAPPMVGGQQSNTDMGNIMGWTPPSDGPCRCRQRSFNVWRFAQ